MSPTARFLKHYRQLGWVVDVVERFVARGHGYRKDFLGCADLIAAKPGEKVLAIQATSASNVASRLKKSKGIAELKVWLTVATIVVVGWGRRDGKWFARIEELTLDSMGDEAEPETVTRAKLPRKKRKSQWASADLFAMEVGDEGEQK